MNKEELIEIIKESKLKIDKFKNKIGFTIDYKHIDYNMYDIQQLKSIMLSQIIGCMFLIFVVILIYIFALPYRTPFSKVLLLLQHYYNQYNVKYKCI